MNCQNCQQTLPAGAQFCGNCGAQVQVPQQTQPVDTQPADDMQPVPSPAQPVPAAPPPTPVPQAATASPVQSAQQPLQPGQPGFQGVPVVPAVMTPDLKKKINYFSIAGMVMGAIYAVASAFLDLDAFSETGHMANIAAMVIDVTIGLLMAVPSYLVRSEKDLKKIKKYVMTVMIVVLLLVVISIASGQSGIGLLPVLALVLGGSVLAELRKANV